MLMVVLDVCVYGCNGNIKFCAGRGWGQKKTTDETENLYDFGKVVDGGLF